MLKQKRLILLVGLLVSVPSLAADRIALVIANEDYAEAGVLRRPVADAELMVAAFKSRGVKVFRDKGHYNLDGEAMETLLEDFSTAAKGAEAALVYYAGHGVQHGGENYLIPVNVGLSSAVKVKHKALSLSLVLDYLKTTGAPVGVVFLDACRNNPFRGTRGLARVPPPADSEILISYSTAANDVAADVSPYTPTLARLIREQPNLSIERLLKKVRGAVSHATDGKQNPDYTSSFGDRDFCFGACQLARGSGNSNPPSPEPEPARQSFEPEMVRIRGGSFMMGSPANEAERNDDEKQHRVNVGDFWIGKYEVTFEQWDVCVTDGGCSRKPNDSDWGRGKRPVISVDWYDATGYAAWLSRRTGKKYRLPTEAEWEYAARAGSQAAYPWGDSINCNQADYKYDECNAEGTSEVGSYAANRWGLHDTVGNVFEWTCSAYEEAYNGAELKCADKGDTRGRVLRGGSWVYGPASVRSAGRYGYSASYRGSSVGFRLLRTP